MAILTWNNQLNVGIASVDQEHQRLVDIINQLDETVAIGDEPQAILDLIGALLEYTHYHFQNEEALMRKAGYDAKKFAEHHAQHSEFVAKVRLEQQKAIADPETVSDNLLEFLVHWLSEHILQSDRKMAQEISQTGTEDSDTAIQESTDIMQSNLYSALRESETRFRALANHLPALIWITNTKQIPIFCNQFWLHSFGISKTDLNTTNWMEHIHSDDRERVQQAYHQVAEQRQPLQIEYRLHRENQSILWILETVVPRLRGNGKFAGLMGCGTNISAQKLTEAELERQIDQRTQELRAANATLEIEKNQQIQLNNQLQETQNFLIQSEKMASIGQLAAGVAHEINNPLGYIYSNLNTLRQYLHDLLRLNAAAGQMAAQLPPDNAVAKQFRELEQSIDLDFIQTDLPDLVSEAMEGAVRAKKIVQDLRDFSRIDKPERMPFDLEAGMDATLNIVHSEVKFKAEVVKEYAGIKPFPCVGAQINQIFMNLVVNAAQSIPDFGKITIRTGYQDEDWLWVEVEDTGSGIPEDIQARIFDPFFTTKPVGKGTGLGLSLSYKIVQDHGGRIELDSKPGKGSRFRIYLPTR